MLRVVCDCGAKLKLPEEHLGRAVTCPKCQTVMRAVSGGGQVLEFDCRLVIVDGIERVGEQFLLGGDGTIEIGKLEENAIQLEGVRVSRSHCRLIPTIHGGWAIEDTGSTNGLYLNGERITCETLNEGDRIGVGDFLLRFRGSDENAVVLASDSIADSRALTMTGSFSASAFEASAAPFELENESEEGLYDLSAEDELAAPAPVMPARAAVAPIHASLAATPLPARVIPVTQPGPRCPSCSQMLAAGAKICVGCGIDIKTGRALVTSRGLDEETLEEHASIWIRFISWFMPVGFLPIASEAFGTRKPYVVWSVTALTILTSLAYLPVLHNFEKGEPGDGILLMQWSGNRDATLRDFQKVRQEFLRYYREQLASERPARGRTQRGAGEDVVAERELDQKLNKVLEHQLPPSTAKFHGYQLVTSGFLHAGVLHLAGNLLFMLIFGWRVNELIGNVKMIFVYPLLMIASAATHHVMASGEPLAPYLGASGAIMGLAGMYVVLFPAQKVHMIAWFRILVIRGWKIFRMRGIWMLLLWIAWQDGVPTLLKSSDHVAHWSHLGGFVAGAFLAIILLLTRLVTARGTDLLSVLLGRHAWNLMGKPRELSAST